MTWVIATDRPCRNCGEVHGYVTKGCNVVVYVDHRSALLVCEHHKIPLLNVAPINLDDAVVARDLGLYVLDITRNGRPDERYPRTSALPRRRS